MKWSVTYISWSCDSDLYLLAVLMEECLTEDIDVDGGMLD